MFKKAKNKIKKQNKKMWTWENFKNTKKKTKKHKW